MIEGQTLHGLYEERPTSTAALLALQPDDIVLPTLRITQHLFTTNMIHVIELRLEIRLDCEKNKPTRVAPYIRFRNGKKELVKGYVRKNRGL